MGKKIKKGKVGPILDYISRSKAIKKLQVSLKDFRRLCILKGIYPREPPKSLKKQNKTYYHQKDINYLNHESILEKFREKKAHIKKIKRAISRGEKLRAANLKRNTPNYSLDHLVKERYPTFIDALNDLDDPLCLISLFASFPAHKDLKISNNNVLSCQRLIKQFQIYVAKSHSLRKVFLSIKGIYYQANIHGVDIVWIQPFPLAPQLPLDVDYKVMSTFLEFYQTLMKFVNFKLFKSDTNFGINQYIGTEIRKLQEIEASNKKNEEAFEIDEKFQNDEQVKLINKKNEENKYSSLFKGLIFQLSTEVPRQSLQFVILSFGGQVCWDGDEQNIDQNIITHIVTERTNIAFDKRKEYIQPQWVYDSINQLKLLTAREYAPDKILPPHLSPFDKSKDLEEDNQQDEDVEEVHSDQGIGTQPHIKAPVKDTKSDSIKQKKQKKMDVEEEQRLAESVLTRKNKRLYDMIKRKEQVSEEKKNILKSKKKNNQLKMSN